MVQTIKSPAQLSGQIDEFRKEGKSIGFVPTMGALHEGHMNLIKQAREENDLLIVSIFVNPTQFDDPEDYRRYPRTWDADLMKLEEIKCDLLFMPGDAEMYPDGYDILKDFDPGYVGKVLEGRFRPGHFQGVATVVKKLLAMVQPDYAYFGQKDYQQLLVIKKLVKDYALPVSIIPVPTTRGADGLAVSSRNVLLNKDQRKIAPVIYETLKWAGEKLKAGVSIEKIQKEAYKYLEQQQEINTEYFEIRDTEEFVSLNNPFNVNEVVICTALYLGNVRLIDNLIVKLGT